MKKILIYTLAMLILSVTFCFAQSVSAPKSIQITVYNDNFALVKDTRIANLIKGQTSIELADVAAQIDPTSVLFKSISDPNSITILEQNYQFDLINPNNILSKLVGERVWLDGGQSGILLNPPDNGGMVVKLDDGKLLMNPAVKSVEKMPEGLHPRPTLNWLIQSSKAGEQNVEVSYLTNGASWKADYVVLVNSDDSKLDLAGWVTLTNNTGATYTDAKLTLMAGDVRRVQERNMGYGGAMYKMDMAMPAAAPQFEEKSFFEYHIYTMARPTTISDKETKQLSLLNAANVPVKKEYIYDARGDWFRSWWYPGRRDLNPGGGYDTSNYHKVNVMLEVKNSKENNMGMPLPKGKIRVYKLDDSGSQQFVGEDQIDHTPKDEKVRMYVGDAFDVLGDYVRTDYKVISDRVVQESFSVKIKNHKDQAVEVRVVDHVWSDWSVTQKSHEFTKKDASTIEFPVKVPANGETKVTYTILTKW